MDENELSLKGLFTRYIIAILLFLLIDFIYVILKMPTLFLSTLILDIFYNVDVYYLSSLFVINDNNFELVEACIAGSAFVLLVALNLVTSMDWKTRIKSLAFLLLSLFVLNVIRISAFATLYVNEFTYFDFTHYAFWYFGSTILVVLLWFSAVRIFNISSIPLYTDIRLLIQEIRGNKK